MEVRGPGDLPGLRMLLLERFRSELEFLRSLPTILESEHLVFVHGGVPSYAHMEELDAWQCMKNDDFLGQGRVFPKYCVVGHWPVALYRGDRLCSNPIIERTRKIISIDGGCVLKRDGQLNALVIPEAGSEAFSWISYDDCPVKTALDRQEEGRDAVVIHWTDDDVEVLERGEEFSLCRQASHGPDAGGAHQVSEKARGPGLVRGHQRLSLGGGAGRCALHCGGDQPGLSLQEKRRDRMVLWRT